MFDEICSELRDIIQEAIDKNVFGSNNFDSLLTQLGIGCVSTCFTDDGLAVAIDDRLYSISIQKV